MCVCFISYREHSEYPFILTHNRDEFYARATAPAEFWKDHPQILAGRDLVAGGTWLGFSTQNRLALVTNYRNPQAKKKASLSRGILIPRLLKSPQPMEKSLRAAMAESAHYSAFNLLGYDGKSLEYGHSLDASTRTLPPGHYGLSNGRLDSPWPKVQKIKERATEAIQTHSPDDLLDALMQVMMDESPAPDSQLPDTGIGKEWEKMLSPIFVRTETYGTRATTLILIDRTRNALFLERTWHKDGTHTDRKFTANLGVMVSKPSS